MCERLVVSWIVLGMREMKRPRAVVISCVVVMALSITLTRPPAQGATVGGPPTSEGRFSKLTGVQHPTSSPIVVARAVVARDSVEIVGMASDAGLCVFVWHPKRTDIGGGCDVGTMPFGGLELVGTSIDWDERRGFFSDVFGIVSPSLARVGVRAKELGARGRRRLSVVHAWPDPSILEHLQQTTPFGVFVGVTRGCVRSASIRVTGFDSAGLPAVGVRGAEVPKGTDGCAMAKLDSTSK